MSQGWRLPDGTPCGHKSALDHVTGSESNTDLVTHTGYCYNGQCRAFDCHGEVWLRQSLPSASTNVYNGNETSGTTQSFSSNTGTCSLDDVIKVLEDEEEERGADDTSYQLVRVKTKGTLSVCCFSRIIFC